MLLSLSVMIYPERLPLPCTENTTLSGSGLPSIHIAVDRLASVNVIMPPSTSQTSAVSPASSVQIVDAPTE